jgi:hypothetical protein
MQSQVRRLRRQEVGVFSKDGAAGRAAFDV